MNPSERGGARPVPALAAVVLFALLVGAAALEFGSGGVRGSALGPAVLAVALTALGCVLLAKRPGLNLAPLLLGNGLGFAMGTLAAGLLDYATSHPVPSPLTQVAFAVVTLSGALSAAWVLFILWFPDGRFTSSGWRTYWLVSTALYVVWTVVMWLVGPADQSLGFYRGTDVPAGAAGPWAGTWPAAPTLSNLLLVLPLIALLALVGRFRRADGAVRQQLLWLLIALGVEVCAQVVSAVLIFTSSGLAPLGTAVAIASQPVPALAATLAILRYRLWDIDLVLARTIGAIVLWAVLSLLFVMPSLAAGLLVGGRGAVAAVAAALLVVVMFQPVRRRLDTLADRVVGRGGARPYAALSGLWERLRTAELHEVGPLLADTVRKDLHLEWVAVWAFEGGPSRGRLRQAAGPDTATRPTLDLAPRLVEELASSGGRVLTRPFEALGAQSPPEAVIPLVAADELVGVLACGGRRGDRLRPADFETLELVARECALRLRNLMLSEQLKRRLSQIEAQAVDLTRSRQRLVAAQDHERRRIERNLHDGVQQQLVSLAVRLRRVASSGDPSVGDLADDAEEAVFALQELARGIFPGVLTDQGLPAALRTQAARMPMPVHLAVDDNLNGTRLEGETEAALYFVALEALTNVQKHASHGTVDVWLHTEQDQVVLDIVDSGPGLRNADPDGSGLQNMRDRISAVGGTIEIASAPGRGTRVTATVLGSGAQPPRRR